MEKIKFGTDGWRAKIAEGFTFKNLARVVDAYAVFMQKEKKHPSIAVGYDNRFMSERYAVFTAKRLAERGFSVYLFDAAVHTPLVSFAVVNKKLDGGVVITSSHNPFTYNGFKIKDKFGAGAGPEDTKRIEKILERGKKPLKGKGRIKRINLDDEYIEEAKKIVDVDLIKKSKVRIVLDVMFGSGAGYIERILKGYKNIRVINNRRDPLFGGINPEPIKQNLKQLSAEVKKRKAGIGIALDGDGDRMGVVDDKGRYLSPHKVFAFLVLHHINIKKMMPDVVRTISGTMLLDKIADRNRLKLYEVPVGFKNIAGYLKEHHNMTGGEESGGVGFGYYLPERDGVIGNLLLLEYLAAKKKKISSLLAETDKEYGVYRYDRIDKKFREEERAKILSAVNSLEKKGRILKNRIKKVNRLDGTKYILESGEWLLFRFSGTEPLLRIYCEASSEKRVRELLSFGADVTG